MSPAPHAAIAAHWLAGRGHGALVDIDFHHGNGSQDIFWRRSDVLTVLDPRRPG